MATLSIPGLSVTLDCYAWGYQDGRQFGVRNEGTTEYGVLHREVTGTIQRKMTIRFAQTSVLMEQLRRLANRAGREALPVTFTDHNGASFVVDWPEGTDFHQELENRRDVELLLLEQSPGLAVPVHVVPAGTLAFSGYGDAPIRFVSTAGAFYNTVQHPWTNNACGFIGTLPSNRIACVCGFGTDGQPDGIFNPYGIGIYTPDFSSFVLGEGGSPGSYGWTGACDRSGYFYGASSTGTLIKHDSDGHRLSTLDISAQKPTGTSGLITVLAVNAAGTISYQYWQSYGTTDYLKVKAWNLASNTNLGVFATAPNTSLPLATSSVLGMLVLANGDVLIGWGTANVVPDGSSLNGVCHYSSGGSLLHQYFLPGRNCVPICIRDSVTPGKVWVNYYDQSPAAQATSSNCALVELTLGSGACSPPLYLDDGAFEFDSPFTVLTAPGPLLAA